MTQREALAAGPAFAGHVGQFVLTEDADRVPDGWTTRERDGWRLATNDLPVVDVVDRQGLPLGWCLGHVVVDGALAPPEIRMPTAERRQVDWTAVDALYERLAGRFLLVLLTEQEATVLPDAYGSLAAVHSSDGRTVASVPTLLGGSIDDALVEVTGFPDRATWLPFGLTVTRGVERLPANHSLDLRTWRTQRRWTPPVPRSDLAGQDAAAEIYRRLAETVDAVARVHPVCLSLTGGRDSRVLLAAARHVLDEAVFFTLQPEGRSTVDEHLASRLAERHGLRHVTLPFGASAPEHLDEWLSVTGHALGGELWRAHGALRGLDPLRVLLPGTAGEVGRAHTYREGDPVDGRVSPELLLARLRVPRIDLFLERAEAWLATLPDLPFSTTLELAYIEQRLSCWAGPGHYGNRTSRFELAPYASRPMFRHLLSLPLDYRRREGLAGDILAAAWPELLDLPFNEFTGFRGRRNALVRTVKGRGRRVLDRSRAAKP